MTGLKQKKFEHWEEVAVDFGSGTPIDAPTPPPQHSMKAYFERPVREAAGVFVNGPWVGFVWHPAYTVNVTRFLKAGENSKKSPN